MLEDICVVGKSRQEFIFFLKAFVPTHANVDNIDASDKKVKSMDLNAWIAKLKLARSHKQMFALLDEFRKSEWTDEERSKIAHVYIRLLDNLQPAAASDESEAAPAESEHDGPVWY
jgi:hypothetical protein